MPFPNHFLLNGGTHAPGELERVKRSDYDPSAVPTPDN